MKFAISARQDYEYLEKADEINVQYRDKDYIFDLIEKYPGKKYVLDASDEINPDWNWIIQMAKACPDFILRVSRDYSHMLKCAEEDIPFFAGYPINDWAVFRAYVELGPTYVVPAGELFFRLDELKKYNIPVRVCANRPFLSNIVLGANTETDLTIPSEWIRPDDVPKYENYVDVIEFFDVEKSKEQALYRIYAQDKHWPGSLQMIINNLKTDATCRLIEPEIFSRRINCGRKCLSGGPCRMCFHMFSLANYEKLKEYKETVIDNKEKI